MKKQRFSEEQIIRILKEYDSGKKVTDVAREYGISDATLYNWKKKYSGMEKSELRRLRELESENGKLRRIVADLNLENYALKDVIEKKL
jgi:putative transposase